MISYLVYNNNRIIRRNKLPSFPVFEVISNNYPRAKSWRWNIENDSFSQIWQWNRHASLSLSPNDWTRNIAESTILYWLELIADKYFMSFNMLFSSLYRDKILLMYNNLLHNIYNNVYSEYINRLNYETYTIPYEPYWKYSFNELKVDINGIINPSIKSQTSEVQIVKNHKQGSKSIDEMPSNISFLALKINDIPSVLKDKKIYIYGTIKAELTGDKYWSNNKKYWITKDGLYIV